MVGIMARAASSGPSSGFASPKMRPSAPLRMSQGW
jgi:hypothetical protein